MPMTVPRGSSFLASSAFFGSGFLAQDARPKAAAESAGVGIFFFGQREKRRAGEGRGTLPPFFSLLFKTARLREHRQWCGERYFFRSASTKALHPPRGAQAHHVRPRCLGKRRTSGTHPAQLEARNLSSSREVSALPPRSSSSGKKNGRGAPWRV